jgi:hypothetical protein
MTAEGAQFVASTLSTEAFDDGDKSSDGAMNLKK